VSHHQDIRSTYLHEPSSSNRNYFQILQDNEEDDVTQTTTQSPSKRSSNTLNSSAGEGVLIPGYPGIPFPALRRTDASWTTTQIGPIDHATS
jgi:hypothetical protein